MIGMILSEVSLRFTKCSSTRRVDPPSTFWSHSSGSQLNQASNLHEQHLRQMAFAVRRTGRSAIGNEWPSCCSLRRHGANSRWKGRSALGKEVNRDDRVDPVADERDEAPAIGAAAIRSSSEPPARNTSSPCSASCVLPDMGAST